MTCIVSSYRLASFILLSALGVTNLLLTKDMIWLPICKKIYFKISCPSKNHFYVTSVRKRSQSLPDEMNFVENIKKGKPL